MKFKDERIESGREFQIIGAAVLKERELDVLSVSSVASQSRPLLTVTKAVYQVICGLSR